MEPKTGTKNKLVRVVIWIVVIAGVLFTIHTLVNYFDLFEFVRKLHGG
jgi:hypothetical protein